MKSNEKPIGRCAEAMVVPGRPGLFVTVTLTDDQAFRLTHALRYYLEGASPPAEWRAELDHICRSVTTVCVEVDERRRKLGLPRVPGPGGCGA